jgi:hypothetical protein
MLSHNPGQRLSAAALQTEQQLQKLPAALASDTSFDLFNRLRDLARAVAQAVEGSDSADVCRAADRHYTVRTVQA